MILFDIIKNKHLREVLRGEPSDYYLTYKIPKKTGGYREIDAPQDPLKEIQRDILYKIYYFQHPSTHAKGFVPGRELKEGAKEHLGAKVILNIDIKNFFPSFHWGKLLKLNYYVLDKHSKKFGISYEEDDVENLTRLISFKKRLPQGSPASPFITNIGFRPIDRELSLYCDKQDLTYTRYADDLSFSSKDYSVDMMPHLHEINKIIEKDGFKIKDKKTRILRPHNRMSVTGVTINDKLGVPKWKVRNFRAKIHNLKTSGKPVSLETYEKIRGYAEWIRNLNEEKGKRFIEEIGSLNLDF